MDTNVAFLRKQLRRFDGFIKKYNLYLHPLHTAQERAAVVVKLGHCICDPKRPLCPCRQAIWEIRKTGHCFCWLFFSERGLREYYPEKAEELIKCQKDSSS